MSEQNELQLSCMEIWGGNTKVHSRVELDGVSAWVCCVPFGDSEQGGDMHYMTSCATGRITRILVADVSGHGEMVAQYAVQLKRLMRRYTNYISQQKLVRDLNSSFSNYTSEGKFATAVAMTYFSPTGVLSFSNAGHPSPFLYKASKNEWSVLETNGQSENDTTGDRTDLPFGVIDNAEYSQNKVQLDYNDIVLLYTDSLIDARGPDGERLGVEGALELVRSLSNPQSDTLIDQIKAKLYGDSIEWHDTNLDDDMTLLLFSPSSIGNISWSRKVKAPWLMTKALLQSVFARGGPIPWPEFTLRNLGGAFINALNKLKK